MADLDALALKMPHATKQLSADGRPEYRVHDRMFCAHRSDRKDAVDPLTGDRLSDVLMFRVADLEMKRVLLEDPRGLYFTTPHFDGYSAVLLRIPSLDAIAVDELDDLVVEAWLTQAQKRVAKAWLAEQSSGDAN